MKEKFKNKYRNIVSDKKFLLFIIKSIFLFLISYYPVNASPLDDIHLNYIPRTAEEYSRIEDVTSTTTDFDTSERYERMSAGAATVEAKIGVNAFSQPSENLTFEDQLNFRVGNGLFRKLWVSSPSSTLASDGLGPLFNARSCQRCHIKDGRGHPPNSPDDNSISMVILTSIPASFSEKVQNIKNYLSTSPEPTYGKQLQDFSVAGHLSEYQLEIEYEEVMVPLSGGEVASLRKPIYTFKNLRYGPLHPEVMFSPRVAPQMIGLGLLETIPTVDILSLADPDDTDGDGISGRPNIVWSKEYEQPMLGRFGLKAGTATIQEQSAAAFSSDIGISNPLFPAAWGDCTQMQSDCRQAQHGNNDVREHEIDQESLDLVVFYSQNLGVPSRRNVDNPEVLRGKDIFYSTGCISCHQPSFVTHRLEDRPEHSFQLIWPYTDMLLHDMGEGLADDRPEYQASGTEWRTPPLWGIGLTQSVSGHTNFLHDGRARSLLEAILWHGGEAEKQRDQVINMRVEDRNALIQFLNSL